MTLRRGVCMVAAVGLVACAFALGRLTRSHAVAPDRDRVVRLGVVPQVAAPPAVRPIPTLARQRRYVVG
jgi:hypothetical protein